MSNYKEIVTKTVIGKGKKNFSDKYSINVKIKILTEDNEEDWQNLNDLDEKISEEIDKVNDKNII